MVNDHQVQSLDRLTSRGHLRTQTLSGLSGWIASKLMEHPSGRVHIFSRSPMTRGDPAPWHKSTIETPKKLGATVGQSSCVAAIHCFRLRQIHLGYHLHIFTHIFTNIFTNIFTPYHDLPPVPLTICLLSVLLGCGGSPKRCQPTITNKNVHNQQL